MTYSDLIVMSQACDILQGKVRDIALCMLFPLDSIAASTDLRMREELRRGHVVSRHLLNASDENDFSFHVVDFRRVFTLPISFLSDFAAGARRLRLLPPYREHLAQAFARFFMRVGLPADIPPFV